MLVRPTIDSWVVDHIESIRSEESRRLVPLPVPGLSGDLHQDLGRGAMAVEIVGSLSGDEARDKFLKDLRGKFLAGDPVDFVADIVKESELERVLIEALDMEEQAGEPETFRYRIVLREYTEPPEPPSTGADFGLDVDADLGLDIGLGLDLLDLPSLMIPLPEITDMLSPVKTAAQGLKDALKQSDKLLEPLNKIL